MRNYKNFDNYLDNIYSDVYEQPPDEGHKDFAQSAIDWAFSKMNKPNVLDVGCGQGFCSRYFEDKGIKWHGVTVGKDYQVCRDKGLNVKEALASFLPYPDNRFSTVFARHILEHSPFPILTLMEWKRVSRGHLVLVYPAWEYWGKNGRNHYYVLDKDRLWYNLTRAGWYPIHQHDVMTTSQLFDRHYPSAEDNEESYPGAPIPVEYWYICEQREERID